MSLGAADLRARRPARRSRRCARPRRARDDASARRPRREVELAAEIVDAVPSVEKVRLVSSGTEAAMSAVRLARGFTRRDRILKFAGCYHGHATRCSRAPAPASPRSASRRARACPTAATADTIVVPVQRRRRRRRPRSSATARGSRRSSSSRSPGTWASSRRRRASSRRCGGSATRRGALLVFDEVITGFRVARGGAQERFGVAARPDDPRQDRRRRPAARRRSAAAPT